MKKDSRVKAVISLDAVEHNFREMRKNLCRKSMVWQTDRRNRKI